MLLKNNNIYNINNDVFWLFTQEYNLYKISKNWKIELQDSEMTDITYYYLTNKAQMAHILSGWASPPHRQVWKNRESSTGTR